ncbi:MAG: hypothetical protein ACK55W_17400 [Pseudomonadota bacterium]
METTFEYRLIRYVISVFMWTLAGRGVLWLILVAAGADPKQNKVYQVLTWMVWPVLRPLRTVIPKQVPDAYVALMALPLLWLLLIAVGIAARHLGWVRLA